MGKYRDMIAVLFSEILILIEDSSVKAGHIGLKRNFNIVQK